MAARSSLSRSLLTASVVANPLGFHPLPDNDGKLGGKLVQLRGFYVEALLARDDAVLPLVSGQSFLSPF